MSIVVELKNRNQSTPIDVILDGDIRSFSKKAAVELKNKLEQALEELTIYESERDHHANQCNPNNSAHKDALDNHSNQCNPNTVTQLTQEEIDVNAEIEFQYYSEY